MFEQVRVPDSRKGNDYIVTAEINQVAYDDREGPYYFVQKAESGKGRRIKKADFKISMIDLESESFLKTLRKKLLWGEDKRN